MYVVSGRLKGKNIKIPPNVRPTNFRIKKIMLDVLRPVIKDTMVLDLFAGSGNLGIESLSTGARFCYFVDIKKRYSQIIERNLSTLGIRNLAQVLTKDAFKSIKDFYHKGIKFDIVFADPPYYKDYALKTLKYIDDYDIVKNSGFLVLQVFLKDKFITKLKNFEFLLHKRAGQDLILFSKHL